MFPFFAHKVSLPNRLSLYFTYRRSHIQSIARYEKLIRSYRSFTKFYSSIHTKTTTLSFFYFICYNVEMFNIRASHKCISIILCLLLSTNLAYSAGIRRVKTPKLWNKISKLYNSFYSSQNIQLLIQAMKTCHLSNLFWGYRQQKVVILPPTKKYISKNKMELVILTANMFLLPEPFSSNQFQRIKRLKSIIEKEKPDLITLQEVWSNEKLSEIINTFPNYYRIFSISPLYNMSGLIVLSKHRVVNAEKIIFPTSLEYNLQEIIAQKGFINATVKIASTSINFLSTHLYSAGTKAKLKPNYEQFPDIIAYIQNLQFPTIAAGDFNIIPSAIEKLNKNQLIVSSNREYTSGIRPHRKLDYIMIAPKHLTVSYFVDKPIVKPRISDHLPLLSTINFRKASTSLKKNR